MTIIDGGFYYKLDNKAKQRKLKKREEFKILSEDCFEHPNLGTWIKPLAKAYLKAEFRAWCDYDGAGIRYVLFYSPAGSADCKSTAIDYVDAMNGDYAALYDEVNFDEYGQDYYQALEIDKNTADESAKAGEIDWRFFNYIKSQIERLDGANWASYFNLLQGAKKKKEVAYIDPNDIILTDDSLIISGRVREIPPHFPQAFLSSTEITNLKKKTIILEEGIVKINGRAFSNISFADIKLPTTLEEIGRAAFQNVFARKCNLIIPKNVRKIGELFAYNSSFNAVFFPDGLSKPNYCMLGAEALCVAMHRRAYRDHLFSKIDTFIPYDDGFTAHRFVKLIETRESLETVTEWTIADGVTRIEDYEFSCSGLTNIKIPSSVTNIGDSAFCGCSNLKEITIPGSVTSIENYAFSGCSSLLEITIPGSINSIGNSAFSDCTELKKVNIEDGAKEIGKHVFRNCSSLTKVSIPNSITKIEPATFNDCSSLTEILLPDSIKDIEVYAFALCRKLKKINIPNGVTSLSEGIFYGCKSLKEMRLRDGIKTIKSKAFFNCSNLTAIYIPDSTKIEDDAFKNCSNLLICAKEGSYAAKYADAHNIPLKKTASYGEYEAYLKELQIEAKRPDVCTKIQLKQCIKQKSQRTIPKGMQKRRPIAARRARQLALIPETDINLFNVKDGVVYGFNGDMDITQMRIPNGITDAAYGCFLGLNKLKRLMLPGSISEKIFIEDLPALNELILLDGIEIFPHMGGCQNLKKVVISGGIKKIRSRTFSECYNLSDIFIPDGVTSIGERAFYECKNLKSIYIPDGVTVIKAEAFKSCKSLVNVRIPKSVTRIEYAAFALCQSLKKIHIPYNVKVIEPSTFVFCDDLEALYIPNSETKIFQLDFSWSKNLTIYAKADSFAAEYADSRKIPFKPI